MTLQGSVSNAPPDDVSWSLQSIVLETPVDGFGNRTNNGQSVEVSSLKTLSSC